MEAVRLRLCILVQEQLRLLSDEIHLGGAVAQQEAVAPESRLLASFCCHVACAFDQAARGGPRPHKSLLRLRLDCKLIISR